MASWIRLSCLCVLAIGLATADGQRSDKKGPIEGLSRKLRRAFGHGKTASSDGHHRFAHASGRTHGKKYHDDMGDRRRPHDDDDRDDGDDHDPERHQEDDHGDDHHTGHYDDDDHPERHHDDDDDDHDAEHHDGHDHGPEHRGSHDQLGRHYDSRQKPQHGGLRDHKQDDHHKRGKHGHQSKPGNGTKHRPSGRHKHGKHGHHRGHGNATTHHPGNPAAAHRNGTSHHHTKELRRHKTLFLVCVGVGSVIVVILALGAVRHFANKRRLMATGQYAVFDNKLHSDFQKAEVTGKIPEM